MDRIAEARRRRFDGQSIKKIAKDLCCSSSSVSRWVKDIVLSQEQVDALSNNAHGEEKRLKASRVFQDKCRLLRELWREEGKARAKAGDWRHAMFCSLYWAEGGKSINSLVFANTDPMMIKFFYDFLVSEFSQTPSVEFVCPPLDPEFSVDAALDFWASHLGLNRNSIKPRDNQDNRVRSGKKRNKHSYGMCVLKLGSTQVLQHVYGALEVYGSTVLCNK